MSGDKDRARELMRVHIEDYAVVDLTPDEFMLNWQTNNPGLSQTLAH